MSTMGISSSLFSEVASSPSTANQFVTDLNKVAQDLQNSNLSAAQQDYVTLSQDALNGVGVSSATSSSGGVTASLISEIASSPASSSNFVNGLNQLGTDLSNGDLSSAQGDMLSVDSTALSAAPAATAASSSSTKSSPSNSAEIAMLVKATAEAMEVGDGSSVGADMSQLASISTSSQGASYLASQSGNYGASTGSSSASAGSLSQLLQGLNTDTSSSSGSSLNLLA